MTFFYFFSPHLSIPPLARELFTFDNLTFSDTFRSAQLSSAQLNSALFYNSVSWLLALPFAWFEAGPRKIQVYAASQYWVQSPRPQNHSPLTQVPQYPSLTAPQAQVTAPYLQWPQPHHCTTSLKANDWNTWVIILMDFWKFFFPSNLLH